jgi:hypothetical protein
MPVGRDILAFHVTQDIMSAPMLGVWSRDEVVRVDLEDGVVLGPGVADGLEGGSAPERPFEKLRCG